MGNQRRADLSLLIITIFWALSYVVIGEALKVFQPFTLNAFRFSIALLMILPFLHKKFKNFSKNTIKYGIIIGIFLTFTYWGSTFGVKYTTVSKAGFLCCLAVLFTPIFGLIFKGQKPENKFWFGLVVCVIGMGFLTLSGNILPAVGDLVSLTCSIAYSIDLLITETACKKEDVDTMQLALIELAVVSVLNFFAALIFESPISIPTSTSAWLSIAFLSFFCTGLAILVQSTSQKYTSASHVGVIISLQPIFIAFFAYIFLGERLTSKGYLGAFLMVVAIFIMNTDFKNLTNRQRRGRA